MVTNTSIPDSISATKHAEWSSNSLIVKFRTINYHLIYKRIATTLTDRVASNSSSDEGVFDV